MTSQAVRTQERVLVAGATGGVGQLTVAKLLEKGFPVRVLTRSTQKAEKMFDRRVETAIGDLRDPTTLAPVMRNVTHIVCCTGTTAFPSTKWDFDTTTGVEGLENFIEQSSVAHSPSSLPQGGVSGGQPSCGAS